LQRWRRYVAGSPAVVTVDRRQLPKPDSYPVSRDSQARESTTHKTSPPRRARLAGHATRRMPWRASAGRPRPARDLPCEHSPARSPGICPLWRDSCTLSYCLAGSHMPSTHTATGILWHSALGAIRGRLAAAAGSPPVWQRGRRGSGRRPGDGEPHRPQSCPWPCAGHLRQRRAPVGRPRQGLG